MIAALEGIIALLTCLGFGITWVLIETPAGAHHKPPHHKPPRRQREYARDEATVERIFVHARADTSQALAAIDAITRKIDGLGGRTPGVPETSGPAVPDETPGSGPAAGPEPLMPLPPEVKHGVDADDDEDACEQESPRGFWCTEPAGHSGGVHIAIGTDDHDNEYVCDQWADEPEPAEPLDVATPEDQADAYVGDLGPAELPAFVPDPEMDYRDATGTWEAIRDDVAAEVAAQ